MGKPKRNKRINAIKLARELGDTKSQLKFFQEAGIVPKKVECSKCHAEMTSISYKKKRFMCTKCKSSRAWFTGTFMFGAKISMRKVIMLGKLNTMIVETVLLYYLLFPAYFFCCHPRMTQLNVIHEVGDSNDDDDSSDADTATPTTDIPVERGEGNESTESLFFSRPTLW